MNQFIIGVDIGTTHTKAVVTTTAGKVLFEEKASYPTHQPLPGYSEQDPEEIFEAVLEVLKKLLASVPEKENIAAVCFSAAMHSLMAVDHTGQALTNLFTWADIRSKKYAANLKSSGKGKRIYLETGTAIHPMSPLCKIAWIKHELPEVFAATNKFISVKEFVFYRLFGRYVVDISVASATGLFDIRTFKWHEEALEFAGITSDHLSEPVSSTYKEKNLNEVYGKRIGLATEVPFFIGSSDGCLAILGSGATSPDEAALTIGTSGAVRKLSDHSLNDHKGRLFNYLLDDKMFVCGGASNNGGIVLKWFSENMLDKPFTSADAFDWFMQTAARAPIASKGLIFLPYIYGERSPVWDADARGVFLGISSIHSKEHFMRAILEGICFSLYQVVQALEESGNAIDTVYASGGFIQSDFWLQVLSDILNKKIVVSHAADASAMGAVFIALYALGYIKDWGEVKKMVVTSAVFHPDQEAHVHYGKNFTIFETVYKKFESDFAVLSDLNGEES